MPPTLQCCGLTYVKTLVFSHSLKAFVYVNYFNVGVRGKIKNREVKKKK